VSGKQNEPDKHLYKAHTSCIQAPASQKYKKNVTRNGPPRIRLLVINDIRYANIYHAGSSYRSNVVLRGILWRPLEVTAEVVVI
jgi:effector-binding domain-containing protein